MRAGATDFVVKPASPERLQVSLRNALATKGADRRICNGSNAAARARSPFPDIITRSPAMRPVLHAVEKAAGSAIPVSIEGESGVGKELIARAIHGSGQRPRQAFVAVNCGAMPENLVESILFGHEKGAFTGATEKHTRQVRRGRWRHAVPRRGRRAAAGGADQVAARLAGGRSRVGRRPQDRQGRRAHRLRHQPRFDRRREGRTFPRGTCSTVSTYSRFSFRRCATRLEDIPALTRHFLARIAAEERQAHARCQFAGAGFARRLSLARQRAAT